LLCAAEFFAPNGLLAAAATTRFWTSSWTYDSMGESSSMPRPQNKLCIAARRRRCAESSVSCRGERFRKETGGCRGPGLTSGKRPRKSDCRYARLSGFGWPKATCSPPKLQLPRWLEPTSSSYIMGRWRPTRARSGVRTALVGAKSLLVSF